MRKHPLIEQAEHDMQAYLADLKAIVNIDSGTYTKAGVDRVGAYLQELFQQSGFATSFHAQQEYGDHLIATYQGDVANGARIVLIGHIDTVFPEGEAELRPFALSERAGRQVATGPGVLDMKSGVLIGLYALRLLLADQPVPCESITFICNTDEEIGSITSKALIQELALQSDTVLVLEPGHGVYGVVTARRGSGRYRLDVQGVAAHSGAEIQRGCSAILEIAYQVQALQALNGTIPGTSLNVGVIHGGERENIVPDYAYCLIDMRANDEAGIEAMEEAMRDVASKKALDETSITLSGGMRRQPFTRTAANARLTQLVKKAGKELGLQIEEFTSGGASDANHTSLLDIPTLDGLGASGDLAHNAGEYIEVATVPMRIALLANLIQYICAAYRRKH